MNFIKNTLFFSKCKRQEHSIYVKVNFMYQCDQIMQWPDVWVNVILVFVGFLMDEIDNWIDRLSKADHSPKWVWAPSFQLKI